jgi:hypothetical protein
MQTRLSATRVQSDGLAGQLAQSLELAVGRKLEAIPILVFNEAPGKAYRLYIDRVKTSFRVESDELVREQCLQQSVRC